MSSGDCDCPLTNTSDARSDRGPHIRPIASRDFLIPRSRPRDVAPSFAASIARVHRSFEALSRAR